MNVECFAEPDTFPGFWSGPTWPCLSEEPGRLGTVLGARYHVLCKLGQGGMAVVYLAEDLVLCRRVALKVLEPGAAQILDGGERFLREARAAARVRHEGIVDVFDFGRADDGTAWLAMEHLEGADLSEELGQGPLPFERVRLIARQVCAALGAAHAQGIVHGDLKPENVFLLRREGQPEVAKVLDFGANDLLRGSGLVIGTPAYISPEQARGEPVDQRTDVYALGCVLYELITGHQPFEEDSVPGLLASHVEDVPIAPSRRAPDAAIPPALDALVLRALAKKPADRHQSMAELAAALDAVTVGQAAPARPRRRGGRLALIALLLVAAAAAFAVRSPRLRRTVAHVSGNVSRAVSGQLAHRAAQLSAR